MPIYIGPAVDAAYGAEREGGAVHFHWRFRHVANGSNRRIIYALPESESEEEIIRFVSQKGEVSLQQLTRAFPDGAATIKALIGRGRLSEFQQIKDKLQKNDKSGRACRIE